MFDDQHTLSNQKRSSGVALQGVEVVGLHKQTLPKSSYRFVLVVTWQDGSRSTIYRKLKEIKWFQNQLALELSKHPNQEEASRYLAKLKPKTRPGIITSSLGTAQRLRMIDALNLYFEAVTYYLHDVEQYRDLKYFVSPSSLDVDAPNWSKNGKTFLCSSNPGHDAPAGNGVTIKHSRSLDDLSSARNLPDQTLRRNAWSMTSCMSDDSSIYVADEDHVPRDEDASHNVIGLNAGEKVQVISKTETGWWFVKRICVECEDPCGYVPGSFLTPDKQPDDGSSITCDCKQTDGTMRVEGEAVYESVCYPLNHKPAVAKTTKPMPTKPRPPVKPNNYINTKLPKPQESVVSTKMHQPEKMPVQNFNLHRMKIQNLFATKV